MWRRPRLFPPVHIFTEPCPALGETARSAGVVDQPYTEEVDAVLEVLRTRDKV